MRIYFEFLDSTELGNVKFTDGTKELEVNQYDTGKYYYVDVTGIEPNNLINPISITANLKETGNSYTVTVNPMHYVREMLEKDTAETEESLTDLSKLLCALYSYYNETVEHLNPTESSNN